MSDTRIAPSAYEAVEKRVAANAAKKRKPTSEAMAELIRQEGGVIWTSPKTPIRKEIPKISSQERQRRLAINNAEKAFPELYSN